jgi:hypothetical protein
MSNANSQSNKGGQTCEGCQPDKHDTIDRMKRDRVEVTKSGQGWRATGAGGVLLGVFAALAGSPPAGLVLAGAGLVLFLVGQALE